MPDFIQIIICFFIALSISLYSVPIIVRVDNALKLFDKPNERSSSEQAIPTLGGIAIFFSFVFACTIGMFGYDMPELIFILAAALLIFFVGLKDDLVNLSPNKKLLAEIIAAVIIIFPAQTRFTDLHGLFGISQIGIIPSVLLTAFVIVVIINSFNLTDGIDGLASSLTMMIGSMLGVWFFISSHPEYAILSFSLVGATAGFFVIAATGFTVVSAADLTAVGAFSCVLYKYAPIARRAIIKAAAAPFRSVGKKRSAGLSITSLNARATVRQVIFRRSSV